MTRLEWNSRVKHARGGPVQGWVTSWEEGDLRFDSLVPRSAAKT